MFSDAKTALRCGLIPLAVLAACSSGVSDAGSSTASAGIETTIGSDSPEPVQPSTTADASSDVDSGENSSSVEDATPDSSAEPADGDSESPVATAPPWLGTRTLPTNESGFASAQPTPPELADRQFATTDVLPAPTGTDFTFTIGPLAGEPLERSTWEPECPVAAEDLRYITVSFWGFDGRPHTGELIIGADQAEPIVSVFETLFNERFPIEEMRIITQADLDADPTGDSNNTGSYVCRVVTGGLRFSEHAFGLAIDVNPFHNPYVRGELVLPELASAYLQRTPERPGMINQDSIVVDAFASIGWGWGGNWNSLKDYQHFSLNNR